MKFVTYQQGSASLPGIVNPGNGHIIPLGEALGRPVESLLSFVQTGAKEDYHRLDALPASLQGIPVEEAKLCAPIQRPIHDIICVGVNYRDHLEESKSFDESLKQALKKSVYFSKRARFIIGPGDTINSHRDIDEMLDYEVELAVVIGKEGFNIPREQVEDHIFGYTVMNDITARTVQKQHIQWYRGKSFDTFTAMGPCLIHRSAMPFPLELDIQSRLNGEVRQDSNTRYFTADVPTVISELSQGITLEPGDIIATGTCGGVGIGFDPPRMMKPGDTIECEVQGIGTLRNVVG